MRYFVIIFSVILFAFFAPQVFAEAHQPNPDSIPFAPPVSYDVGGDPRSVFCADLDGDGDLDLAVTDYHPQIGHLVSILKNNGDGTFQAAVNYEAGNYPYSIFCADLDGDLDIDLAVTNAEPSKISILKNNGNASFQPAVSYSVGDGPTSVFCADLDGDLDFDIAVTNAGSDNVSILKNDGNGNFLTMDYYSAGNAPMSVFCADLDGDTHLDLAVVNASSDNVSILKNNSDGTFQTAVNYPIGSGFCSVFCADLDGDSDLDLAVSSTSGFVSILKNNGDGTFQDAISYPSGINSYIVFCADLDGDSDLDIAVANHYGSSYLINNGDGTFQLPIGLPTGQDPAMSVFCADLDADVDLDLAVVNANTNKVFILLNLTNSRPLPYSLLSPTHLDIISSPVVDFNWQDAVDPDPDDTIFYTLFVSKSAVFYFDSTIVYNSLLESEYTDSLGVGSYYWKVKAYDLWGAARWSNQTWGFYVYLYGDCNGDWVVDIGDIVYLINYLYKNGPAPVPLASGDATGGGEVDVGDVIYMINYLFKAGPPPSC